MPDIEQERHAESVADEPEPCPVMWGESKWPAPGHTPHHCIEYLGHGPDHHCFCGERIDGDEGA